jgi:uncharacterized protein YqgC (DUF456 family)
VPDILGVSTGAVLGIFLSLPVAGIQLSAFVVRLATPKRLHAVHGVSVVVERLSQGQTACAPDYGAA